MIAIKGFTQVTYKDLQVSLAAANSKAKKETLTIATEIKVKSAGTVLNAFSKSNQLASDEVLSNVMKAVGLPGFIVWENGKRLYFISKKFLKE